MALQTSGAISLSDLRGEFGGSAPDSLSEYYRGGSLVPDTGVNSGVPTSGAISLTDFYGASAEEVTLSGEDISSTGAGGQTAGLRVNSDGTIDKLENGSYTQIDASTDWIIPNSAAPSDYEVRVTGFTGDAFSASPGANGSWFALTSTREWQLFDNDPAGLVFVQNNFTLEIRKGSSGSAIASASYSLLANRNS